ncbi:MAG: peptidylprolyl isomerase [Gammaproteobacteria bacterium]|nr:peptidylprolyl isomerase [Gammaproteobacteria bacterium]MBU6509260.1 peptidylprolyl isomerase [Gammaproteobacteria bacterium]MDE1983201.1 peptidylprolyl isomerase [Gammaproteobacteria bacterium]MDE2107714.1 peptidylprolyl isomerase [Gammaproteobacteria bacterium]
MIHMTTSLGDLTLELYPDKAPLSVENFLAYVDEGFYNGTVFHRVIPKFMIQGGGFEPDMHQKKPHAPIRNEAANGLLNTRYSIALARTSDIHSATSQFFINLTDNAFLDHGQRDYGYAVFGKIVKGTEIVDRIAGVKTGRHGAHGDVPLEPVVLLSAKRLSAAQ